MGSNPIGSTSSSQTTNEALTNLVSILTKKEEREQRNQTKTENDRTNDLKSKFWRDVHNLLSAAPKFDGSGDVLFWLEEMELFLSRHMVSNDVIRINVFVGSLTGAAREWFGSLTIDKSDIDEITDALKLRYGKTYMQRLREFEALKQKSNETLGQYADRVQRAAYGLGKKTEEIIYKFYKSIIVSSHVFDDVINLPCSSLN